MTKENKAIPIYATVTKITLDFLDNNNKWTVLMINPISKGRYRVAVDFIYNNIPKEKYNIEEVERVIYITKK
jgi:phenylpyruvate tautomerase PptA (4-oxalocrotonate tautomerase family)